MDTLAFGYSLPTTGRIRDFNPLETCAARRTSPKKRASFKRLDFCIIINSQSEDFPFNTLPSPESTQYVPKKKYELPRVSNRSNDHIDLQAAIAYP